MLARVPAGAGCNLGSQQVHNWAVFVGGPYCPVKAQETRPGAFFPAETIRTVEQAIDKPLEAYRHFAKPAAEPLDDAVDHAATDQGLADCRVRRPIRAMDQQI